MKKEWVDIKLDAKCLAKAKLSMTNMGGGPGDMTWWIIINLTTGDVKLSGALMENVPLDSNLYKNLDWGKIFQATTELYK